ncbi:hypothetical protein MKEN_00133700 [Mycena kentingensis (nom. inval.)]|nr:hypothetical protein MKEN_00133700 [Mycena kentingensis (nom. inval.)]
MDMNNSCENIEEEITSILKENLDFKGNFAFGRSYADAPNPCLTLDGAGLAPFGKGERTIVDKDVRDTWEMDASKVQFRNPAWKPFVDKVVREVCQTLAVNFEASKPRAELYKLLVYETGSHFLPHVDTEKANGMFASIVIVLPSEFTGGDVHTSHSGVNAVFNSSDNSLTQTTALSWYTDVFHEVKPITSGYRLALSYNLLHTTSSLRPALSSASGAVADLRRLLEAWNAADPDVAPDKMCYVLKHTYSNANLSASALKGADAHVMAILDSLAKDVGFGVGLATLHMHESGHAENTGGCGYGRRRRGRWGYGYGYDDEDEDEDPEFAEGVPVDAETNIQLFVDPDGTAILDDQLEITDVMKDELKRKGHYKQDYEGYMGNYAGTLERFYRNTLLVIWPDWSDIGGGSNRRTMGALQRIVAATGDAPTPNEIVDFRYLCDTLTALPIDKHKTAIDQLFTLAARWRDATLWTYAIKRCCGTANGIQRLEIRHLRAGLAAFGFPVLADSLRPVIVDCAHNARLNFVQDLMWLKGNGCDKQVVAFVREMRGECLSHVRPWASSDELQSVTKEIRSDGGVQRLCDLLLPQIKSLATQHNSHQLEAYIDWLYADFAGSMAESDAKKRTITKLLHVMVPFKPLFPTKTVQIRGAGYYAATQTSTRGDPEPILAFFKKCFAYDNGPLVVYLVEQMAPMARTMIEGEQAKSHAADSIPDVVFPVVPALRAAFEAQSPRVDDNIRASLAELAGVAVPLKLGTLKTRTEPVKQEELATLLDFATGLRNTASLVISIISAVKELPWNETSWVVYLEEFNLRRRTEPAVFGPHVLEMAEVYAQKVALPTPTKAASLYVNVMGMGKAANPAVYIAAMKRCYATGGAAAFTTLAARILQPQTLDASYVREILVPLLPELKTLATAYPTPLAASPIYAVVRRIMALWMSLVLGKQPDPNHIRVFAQHIRQLTCRCTYCVQLHAFLRASDKSSLNMARIGAPNVNHVSKEINRRMPGVALSLETVPSAPHGLIVTKAGELDRAMRWDGVMAQGRTLLNAIGTPAERLAIWGAGYVTALGPLLVQEDLALAAQAAPRNAVAGGSRQAAHANAAVVPAKRKVIEILD